jgi:hypothetical protein
MAPHWHASDEELGKFAHDCARIESTFAGITLQRWSLARIWTFAAFHGQDRTLSSPQHRFRDAPGHQLGDPPSSMRTHDDQITP